MSQALTKLSKREKKWYLSSCELSSFYFNV